jgi:hypothetical protein
MADLLIGVVSSAQRKVVILKVYVILELVEFIGIVTIAGVLLLLSSSGAVTTFEPFPLALVQV